MAPAPSSLRVSSLLIPLLLLSSLVHASILAIDYGSDFMKASLMKPGVPFDVLLNRDSKRKIQSTVGWKKDERLFGADGFNVAARFPEDSFSSLKDLQGTLFQADRTSYQSKISPVKLVETERGTVGLKRPDGSEWTVEELIAMQLAYVKALAEEVGKEPIRDVVVTVPSFFSQFERQAVLDAIEIAGLKSLALINDGTAVAVNYAMTRQFPEKEYHIIYDAGASSIRATIVSFTPTTPPAPTTSSKSSNGKSKEGTLIEVKGIGYDLHSGGTELDRRLRDILVDQFEKKYGKSVRDNHRAMARLWKEAGRVKAILSANSDSAVAVEGLAYDIDFKSRIARETLEKACHDLQIKFAKPILDALKNAGLTLDEINSVILTGGHSRTPMVQAAVRAAVGEAKIAHNVNTDESAVLGAAFYGASLSRQFRTKDIKIQDLTPYDLEVSYPSESKIASVAPRSIRSTIFPAASKTGVKKTLTLKRKDDFSLKLSYKAGHFPDFPQDVFDVEITGIPAALKNLTDRGALEPTVKVTMLLTESGVASITEAVAYGEVKDESIKGKLKGLFSGSSSTTATGTESTSETAAPAPTHGGPDEEEKEVEVTYQPNSIPLDLKITPLSIRPLNFAEKRKARDKLAAIDAAEIAKVKREEARNHLEGYLYRLRDLLDGEDSSPFIEFSKPEEREKLSTLLVETLQWMDEESNAADTKAFWDKRYKLEELENPVQNRYKENETGPKAVDDLQQALWAGRVFLESARQNRTEEEANGLPHKYTDAELEEVEKKLKENEDWLGPLVEKQKTLQRNDDPAFKTLELKARGIGLQKHVLRLLRRKAPKPPKPSTSTTTATASETKQAEATGEAKDAEGSQNAHKTKDEL